MNVATRNYGNTLQLKYNLADSALYVFQTTLTTDFSNQPYTSNEMWFSESEKPAYPVYRTSKGRDFTPALDLYFYHQLGKHQSLSVDVLGTYIRTKGAYYEDEGEPYQYQVDGKTYSLISEAIYENRLKPFTFQQEPT